MKKLTNHIFFTGLYLFRWRGSNHALILPIYLWRPWATAMDQRCRSTAGPTTFANGLLDVSSLCTTKLKYNKSLCIYASYPNFDKRKRKKNMTRMIFIDLFSSVFISLPSLFEFIFRRREIREKNYALHLRFIFQFVPIYLPLLVHFFCFVILRLSWKIYDRWAIIASVIFANASINANDYSEGIRGGSQKALNGLQRHCSTLSLGNKLFRESKEGHSLYVTELQHCKLFTQ